MKIAKLEEEIEVPDKVKAEVAGKKVKITGPNGTLEREFNFPALNIAVEGNTIKLAVKDAKKKEKTQVGTTKAHIKNMIQGAQQKHVYKLKICASHFPMTATVSGDTFTLKNFLGEKIPRVAKIEPGVSVKVEGQEITVEGADIEKTGMVAARIEQVTRIAKRDIRIFQDGIYMIKKPKKEIMA
jgi:large subunit ribosomal protein L6